MKKKGVLKKVTALTMALGICLSSSIISYANPSIAIDYSVAVTNTGESRTYMDSLIGITYQTTINEVSDINATFKINKAGTSQINVLSEIEYGYLDGDTFVRTYTNDGIYKSNQSNEGNMDNSYPIFDVEQVQKDLQAGITDRVYVVVVDGLNPYDWTDNFFAYTFRLTGSNSPAQQTEGWVQNSTGWWWRNADGSYPMNTWKEIDGKQYYFGSDGYMLSNTYTQDGYFVGLDGARIQQSVNEPVNNNNTCLLYTSDIVKLKKPHPCGSSQWEILRVGADFRLSCMGCGHQIMVPRKLVEKNTRGLTKKGAAAEKNGENLEK